MKTTTLLQNGLKIILMHNPRFLFLLVFGLLLTQLLNAQIVIELQPFYSICPGESVQLFPTVSGGDENYTFIWSGEGVDDDSQQNATVTPASSGNVIYSLVVQDGTGLISSATATVFVDEIFITSQTILASCGEFDGAIDITITDGISPYQYVWSNGETNEDIENLAAGTYFVTVIGANNCTVTAEIEVYSDLSIEISEDVVICAGESTTLSANVVDGASYSWSNGAATSSITVSPVATTTYTVEVTNAEGCSNIATVEVSVLENIDVLASIVTVTCDGAADGEIWFINSLPEYDYEWSTGATMPNINNLEEGTYCVTITDFNGCQSAQCFFVQAPSPLILTINGLPDNECETDFILEPIVSGGVAPYIYLWSGPNGFNSTAAVLNNNDNLENGFYTLVVTDVNNCSISQTIEIGQVVEPVSIRDLYLDCNNVPIYSLNLNDIYPSPQYTVEWVGPNGFTYDEVNLVGYDTPGVYILTITDNDFPECPFITSTTVSDIVNGIDVEITDCNIYALRADIVFLPDFFGQINIEWTLPDGSTLETESITPTLSGVYTLSVSIPAFGCDLLYTQYIDLESEICSTLEGYVRYDESENCIAENAETGISTIIVSATDGDVIFNAITDETGYYRMNVPSAIYTITHTLPSPTWTACEESYTIDLAVGGTMEMLDIPIQGTGLCPELSVTLSAPSLRRCFFGTYNLTVCNEGTETAIMPEVVMLLDDFLDFNTANITPDAINGQQLNWVFDEIGVGECKTIIVSVGVSCDAVLGQIHCTEAYATDYPFCGSADEWLGANLEINASCDGDEVVFNVKNDGLGDLTEAVSYIIIEDAIAMMQAAGTIDDLPTASETAFSFPANGSTYTFILDQAPNHPYTLSVSSSIEGCGTNDIGTFSTGFVNQFGQQTATPTSTIFCLENRGAFDPNDKAAIPVGYSDAHYIEPEDKINYRIRFQNTGTDTAFTVVVRDSLSELLDVSTLQRGNSSHDYRLDISGERMLTFTFNNILLPDSTTNLEGSNGFVDFTILPKTDAPLETLIENEAAIYFDFNEPVITNTVFHTLGRDFYTIVNWTNLGANQITLSLFPNPASDKIHLGLDDIQGNEHIVRIIDMNGKQVYQSTFSTREMLIDIQQWPSSWYAIQLLDKQGVLLGSGRLVKQ